MSLDPSIFTRDWHLQDLALERLELDDLDPAAERSVRDHLTSCLACKARHQAIVAELAVPLPELGIEAAPAPTASNVVPLSVRRSFLVAGGAGAVMAMAAAFMVMTLLQPADPQPDPEFQVRGSELSLEVYRQDEKGAVRLQDGDGVRPGDHLGFRVASQEAGYLLVLGIDSTLEPYPCYPADPSRGAQAWAASPRPVQLDTAIQLDATPGQERIVALLCDEPVGLDILTPPLRQVSADLQPWQDLPTLDVSCLQRELRLNKLDGAQ